jgi:tRNA(Ile)-lysidine synthase
MPALDPFQTRVLRFIQDQHLIAAGDQVLVALSGGPDSVVLLHVLRALQPVLEVAQLITVHLDHQLRGEESRQDAQFVRDLAALWNLPCRCESVSVKGYRETQRLSLEMAARECRRSFFQRALRDFEAQRVALGHHADDQAEEILLRLFRGSGPGGLAGMAPMTSAGLIRPLLFATRQEILQYAHDHRLSYRQDSSNLAPFCQRNVLRLEILPLLRNRLQPRLTKIIGRHANLVRDEEDAWRDILEGFWSKVAAEEGENQVSLEVAAMNRLPVAIRRRLLRLALDRVRGHLQRIQAIHIEALLLLLEPAVRGKQIHLPGGLRALRTVDRLAIQVRDADRAAPSTPTTIPHSGTYTIPGFDVELTCRFLASDEVSTIPAAWPHTPECAWLDADQIRWPLAVRSWQPGDRFQPLGLGGTMKLQDFFTNTRIPREQRWRIPILCDQEKICWVMGWRLDDRVKITQQTHRILAIQWRCLNP